MSRARLTVAAILLAVATFCAATGGLAQSPHARAVLPGIDVPIVLDTMAPDFPIRGQGDSISAARTGVFQERRIPVQAASARVEPSTGDPRALIVAIAANGRDPSGSRSDYS